MICHLQDTKLIKWPFYLEFCNILFSKVKFWDFFKYSDDADIVLAIFAQINQFPLL